MVNTRDQEEERKWEHWIKRQQRFTNRMILHMYIRYNLFIYLYVYIMLSCNIVVDWYLCPLKSLTCFDHSSATIVIIVRLRTNAASIHSDFKPNTTNLAYNHLLNARVKRKRRETKWRDPTKSWTQAHKLNIRPQTTNTTSSNRRSTFDN